MVRSKWEGGRLARQGGVLQSQQGESIEVYGEEYFEDNGGNVGSQRRDSEGNES